MIKPKILHDPVAFLLLVATIVFIIIAVYSLRQNNFKMIALREAVFVADQQNGDVESALQKLRSHVHGHMNTNLSSGKFAIKPPIQLKGRYERLMVGEAERIKAANAQVAAAGEANCAARFPEGGFNAPRVACIQEYVAANANKQSEVADDLYKFDFVSPRWSPDLAGFSIVAAGLLGLAAIGRHVYVRFS